MQAVSILLTATTMYSWDPTLHANFANIESGATWWPNLQSMTLVKFQSLYSVSIVL